MSIVNTLVLESNRQIEGVKWEFSKPTHFLTNTMYFHLMDEYTYYR